MLSLCKLSGVELEMYKHIEKTVWVRVIMCHGLGVATSKVHYARSDACLVSHAGLLAAVTN